MQIRLSSGKSLILIGSAVIVAVMALSLVIVLTLPTETSKGHNFLRQLVLGNEEAAQEYVSLGLLDVIRLECERGWITGCVEALIPDNWGGVDDIRLVAARTTDQGDDAELYHLVWRDEGRMLSVVLLLNDEDGSRRIAGWRGFVLFTSEADDGHLLDGARTVNALGAQ